MRDVDVDVPLLFGDVPLVLGLEDFFVVVATVALRIRFELRVAPWTGLSFCLFGVDTV